MSLAERIFRSREPVRIEDPNEPLRMAFDGAHEVKRLLVEYLTDKAAHALVVQETAATQNNPLSLSFAGGELQALTDLLAITGSMAKEQ